MLFGTLFFRYSKLHSAFCYKILVVDIFINMTQENVMVRLLYYGSLQQNLQVLTPKNFEGIDAFSKPEVAAIFSFINYGTPDVGLRRTTDFKYILHISDKLKIHLAAPCSLYFVSSEQYCLTDIEGRWSSQVAVLPLCEMAYSSVFSCLLAHGIELEEMYNDQYIRKIPDMGREFTGPVGPRCLC